MFDSDPFGDDPPPMPPCDHEYNYDVYFEKVKESHMVRRKCAECGNIETKPIDLREDEDPDEMDEEEIKIYFKG
jgi:uncharacterized OB-fold protein